MKKLIYTFLFIILFAMPCFSAEFLPKYNDNIVNYGIGLYFGEGSAIVYEEPDEKSHVVAKLYWDADKVQINDRILAPKNVFAVFLPKNALSGFIALDEQNENYTQIIYDNSKGLTGWIKNAPDTRVFYWRQLFYKYGKTKGLYLFANIPKDERYLKLSPNEDSDISYEFIYPKYIRLQLIKGNWALLKVVEYNDEQKVGWFKWRNSDGTLNMFPQFDGQ